MTSRTLTVVVLALALGAPGCVENTGPDTSGPALDNTLTPELAQQIIEASPAFRIEESTVHVLEWQMDSGEEQGLWAIRRTPENGRTRVTIEVLEAANWLERAEYFSGGVVPMHLRRPISRRLVEVVEIRDAEFPQMKEVRFTWTYEDSPDVLKRLKPVLAGGPYPALARLQFQEDSWQLVGHVRDSRIEL